MFQRGFFSVCRGRVSLLLLTLIQQGPEFLSIVWILNSWCLQKKEATGRLTWICLCIKWAVTLMAVRWTCGSKLVFCSYITNFISNSELITEITGKCHFFNDRVSFSASSSAHRGVWFKRLASLHTFVYTDGELTDLTQWIRQVLKIQIWGKCERENRKKKTGSCSLSCLDEMRL